MGNPVPGDLKNSITKKLFELGQRVCANGGYPYDPALLDFHLQEAVEGRFKEKPLLEFLANFSVACQKPLAMKRHLQGDASLVSLVHIKEVAPALASFVRKAKVFPLTKDPIHLRISRLTRSSRDLPIRAELSPFYLLWFEWFYEALAWKEGMADLKPCFAFIKEGGQYYRVHAIPAYAMQEGDHKNTFRDGDGWCLFMRDADDDAVLSAGHEVIASSPFRFVNR